MRLPISAPAPNHTHPCIHAHKDTYVASFVLAMLKGLMWPHDADTFDTIAPFTGNYKQLYIAISCQV